MDLNGMTDVQIDEAFDKFDVERTRRLADRRAADEAFYARLPDMVDDLLELKKDGGGEFVLTAQHYDGCIYLPWPRWVEFAEQIIETDTAAREPYLAASDIRDR